MHRLLLASLLLSGDEWTSRTLRPGHGEPSTDGFPAARRVRLQVVDAENRGVPGVRVTASWLRSLPARSHGNPDQIPLVTGSEGRITYDGLPATGVVFRVNESAWAPAWLRVDASASSEREVRLRLAPAAPLEALEGRAIGTQRARDHLDRHLAADAAVPRAVHLAHSSRAEELDDLVGTEPVPAVSRTGRKPTDSTADSPDRAK